MIYTKAFCMFNTNKVFYNIDTRLNICLKQKSKWNDIGQVRIRSVHVIYTDGL